MTIGKRGGEKAIKNGFLKLSKMKNDRANICTQVTTFQRKCYYNQTAKIPPLLLMSYSAPISKEGLSPIPNQTSQFFNI